MQGLVMWKIYFIDVQSLGRGRTGGSVAPGGVTSPAPQLGVTPRSWHPEMTQEIPAALCALTSPKFQV